ncbi:MAG: sulfite exporter TauE/SafE family protein [Candidatus Omnitrophica bacterium]|nr:sulfite exporter TauE/SafE family protein [Candidatus Omnitrophota bacterium]
MNIMIYISIGLLAGLVGGLFGLGGGIILVPALVYLVGLTQHQAQGTALAAMVPPITLLAAMRYYYAGNVKIQLAMFACIGFIAGGLLGAHIVQGLPALVLKRLFGCVMLFVAVRMILGR